MCYKEVSPREWYCLDNNIIIHHYLCCDWRLFFLTAIKIIIIAVAVVPKILRFFPFFLFFFVPTKLDVLCLLSLQWVKKRVLAFALMLSKVAMMISSFCIISEYMKMVSKLLEQWEQGVHGKNRKDVLIPIWLLGRIFVAGVIKNNNTS